MATLAAFINVLVRLNIIVGRTFSWLSVVVVVACFTVVVLRYGFDVSYNWLQDLYVWADALMFTAVAGYTFLHDGHVRVDIFYRPARVRTKAWVDLLGFFLFLLPFVTVVAVWSWPYVEQSWAIGESSRNIGGLPGLYVVKSFVLVFCAVIALQGLATAGRSVLVLAGRHDLVPPVMRYEGA